MLGPADSVQALYTDRDSRNLPALANVWAYSKQQDNIHYLWSWNQSGQTAGGVFYFPSQDGKDTGTFIKIYDTIVPIGTIMPLEDRTKKCS